MSVVSTCPACGGAYSGAACVRCMARFADTETELPEPDLEGFELLDLLGRGGMGRVYRARRNGRTVAVKILTAADPALMTRFERECRALASLTHPHVVPLLEVGRAGEHLYFTMEFVDSDLRRRLRRGPLSPGEALRVATEICDALQYAHGRGVLHRDLKPENVLLEKGSVRLADFGLAKIAEASALTRSGAVLGTARYMAPEQSGGARDVDARADLFSLGAIFYEMLTGAAPAGRFQPPSKLAEVEPEFDDIVLKLLQCDRRKRYADAAALRLDLGKRRRSP